jgi:hypothetical protein
MIRELKERRVRIGTSRQSGTAPWPGGRGNLLVQYANTRGNVPGEHLSPLGANSRDVRTTLFPLDLPDLAAIDCGTIEVRAS